MATVTRVRKLVNPRARPKRRVKGKRKMKARRSNPGKHRRRLTPAQIAAGFGGKRAQSARKAARKRKRTANASAKGGTSQHRSRPRKRRANPGATKRRRRVRTVTKIKYRTRVRTVVKRVRSKANPHKKRRRRTTKRASNPGFLISYGPALNPRRKKRSNPSVARKRKRRSNPARRRAATRTRTVVRYKTRRRRMRMNPHHRRRTRRRNPSILSGSSGIVKQAGGIIAGMAVTKLVTPMLTSALPMLGGSAIMSAVASGVVAWGSGELAGKFAGADFGKYVFLGGLAYSGSLLLGSFGIPGVSLSGLTPSNDILLPYNMFSGRGAMVSAGMPQARKGMPGSGFAPAFAN